MANPEHLDILKKGADVWNQWRKENADLRPDLREAQLSGADLGKANLRGAMLFEADLTGANLSETDLGGAALTKAALRKADLSKAWLFQTGLSQADLTRARLSFANLSNAYLWKANLSNANLSKAILDGANLGEAILCGANLYHATFVGTNLKGCDVSGCRVYGISAWDLQTDEKTIQAGLIITPDPQPAVTVDDLEVAQFVYLMLNNEKIRNVLTTIGEKGVLILGRFIPERKKVLDALRTKLRELGYVPMMFDFEKADNRSFTETIKVLAGLSKFIIADITNPKSAPLELQAAVPDYMVPFIPIIQEGEKPFSMMEDLQLRDWVMAVKEYRTVEHLLDNLETKIIRPAIKLHKELQVKKAQAIQIESLDE